MRMKMFDSIKLVYFDGPMTIEGFEFVYVGVISATDR